MTKSGIGKLGKLKCMIKRWHTASAKNHQRQHGSVISAADETTWQDEPTQPEVEKVPAGMHTVYVGKSRRRYYIRSHFVDHPLFQNLVQRSGGVSDGAEASTVVGCEVVLFEHLLWMLDNADPMPESLDELVDFYAC